MPKRIIDGEALWGSLKLARVDKKFRAEYANLLPLATASGSFEADPQKVWAQVYSCNRPDVSVRQVKALLEAFSEAGMLFTWEKESKRWGYWIGIEKPGRLPQPSMRRHYVCGPLPPAEALAEFMSQHMSPRRVDSTQVKPMSQQGCDNVALGIGLDRFGIGLGKALSSPAGDASPSPKPSILLDLWEKNRGPLPAVLRFTKERQRRAKARLFARRHQMEKFLEDWERAISMAARTPFLTGTNDHGWTANFDWFVANDTNYVKVLEGRYAGQKRSLSKNVAAAAEFLRRRAGQVDGVPRERHQPDD